MGVEQNRPYFTPEVAKRLSSAATARSQAATSWQPAAVAMPWTRAITGCGRRVRAVITAEQRVEQGADRRVAQVGAHLLEVVAGAEGLARTGDDHHPRRRVDGDPGELLLEQAQQLVGQAVVGVRAIEGQPHHAIGIAAQEWGSPPPTSIGSSLSSPPAPAARYQASVRARPSCRLTLGAKPSRVRALVVS